MGLQDLIRGAVVAPTDPPDWVFGVLQFVTGSARSSDSRLSPSTPIPCSRRYGKSGAHRTRCNGEPGPMPATELKFSWHLEWQDFCPPPASGRTVVSKGCGPLWGNG